jgi:hypothetical protein
VPTVQRDAADEGTNRLPALVGNPVKGEPAFGKDGELKEAMGGVRKSVITLKNTAAPRTKSGRRTSGESALPAGFPDQGQRDCL